MFVSVFLYEEKVLMKDMRRKIGAEGKIDRCYTGPHFVIKHYDKGIYSLQGLSDPDYIIPRVSDSIYKPN